jgi:tripartite-type tricarboxylate transporter receptor subunit TctC
VANHNSGDITMAGAGRINKPLRTALAVGLLALAAAGHAQSAYPNRPIRMFVPVAPGGNVDIIARTIAEPLSRALGQPVTVENRPSAASLIGTQLVAKAAPDGYTLLAHSNTFVSAPAVTANPGYDPVKDFAGVTLTCRIAMVLVTSPANHIQSVADLIAQAKAKPGEIAYATSGNGSTGHIAAELFSRAAGVRMLHVAYKGNAQSVVDVIAGQVPVMFDQVSTSAQYIVSGKLRALAVTTPARAAILPNVPTLDEAGLKGFNDSTWNGLLAPAGTPPEIVARLRMEVAKILKDPELVKRFGDRGIDLEVSNTPEEFNAYIRSETARYVKLAHDANIKAD